MSPFISATPEALKSEQKFWAGIRDTQTGAYVAIPAGGLTAADIHGLGG